MQIKIILILFIFFTITGTIKAEDFKVVTIKKDTLDLIEYAKNKNLFIVLFSKSYNCFGCFKDIIKKLDSLQHNDTNVSYIFLAECDNSSHSRRKQIEIINKIKNDLNVYFDINKNIFNKYKVDITPAMININNSEINYISFDILFGGLSKDKK